MKKLIRFAPSKNITVRFHEEEVKKIDKKRGKLNRSDYIRNKTLDYETN